MRSPRALLLLLGFAALAIAALQGLTGVTELALYAAPGLVMLGLLVCGRFVGEQAILARRAAARPTRRRPTPRRWTARRECTLASLLERSTLLLRGPPASPRAA
jgi:hypothetical protein